MIELMALNLLALGVVTCVYKAQQTGPDNHIYLSKCVGNSAVNH